jgi:hypothetical protein
MDKICVLELVDGFKDHSFDGSYVSNRTLMGEYLKYKGLDMPKSDRDDKGRKKRQEFYFNDYLAVSIDYSDILEDGVICKIEKHVKYYTIEEEIFCEKTERDIVRNEDKLKMSRYSYAYSELKNSATDTPLEQYVIPILEHYQVEVDLWMLGDSDKFVTSLNSETDANMLIILNKKVNKDSDTVKDMILKRLI